MIVIIYHALMERIANIIQFPQQEPYTVTVTYAERMWTAECDALHLVTEAATYEALTERVWAIAPELLALNGLEVGERPMQLAFHHVETADEHRLMG